MLYQFSAAATIAGQRTLLAASPEGKAALVRVDSVDLQIGFELCKIDSPDDLNALNGPEAKCAQIAKATYDGSRPQTVLALDNTFKELYTEYQAAYANVRFTKVVLGLPVAAAPMALMMDVPKGATLRRTMMAGAAVFGLYMTYLIQHDYRVGLRLRKRPVAVPSIVGHGETVPPPTSLANYELNIIVFSLYETLKKTGMLANEYPLKF